MIQLLVDLEEVMNREIESIEILTESLYVVALVKDYNTVLQFQLNLVP